MPNAGESTWDRGTAPDGDDSGRGDSSDLTSDGGESRSLPERAFGAPLVPDCS
jgi:hypothetical protein